METRLQVQSNKVSNELFESTNQKVAATDEYIRAPYPVEWPFKDMEQDEIIEISEFHGRTKNQVLRMAHNYANQSGKKFACKTSNAGTLYVKRIL
ncbi:conserved hypothetical protein [Vibrio phage 191E37-1]|nr:hypothetical protein NVP1007O_76 [Vibrio phage 1.007.O._10N.261.55.F9]AUS01568.1 hypothetical protein NVP1286O_77 [Vibrio phage 1.286.O._10N.286.55.C4]CAH9013196.1 conserved hypothetical protein [Vibrio phage 191E37-1]CAH9013225.1 conserved hypothetical protein [Vibrio phage 115E34-1]CAH9016385.1 conserved hypothetical protein [Vibrio phage 511E55-1]CAH9016983.1 conserved hypothetical protein [Vibrio phage 217E38-1]